jgi:DNA-binding response OmpR family regulator
MYWSTTGIILFVDGDSEIPTRVSEALGDADYIVLHAATPQEAASVLSHLKSMVDLLVVDLELPDETGPGVVTLLGTPGVRYASTIIARTSRQDKSFLRQLHCLGVDTILPKRTSVEQLVGTVQAALSGCPKWFG